MYHKFLHDGLDLERFAVLAVWPQPGENRHAVILMKSRYLTKGSETSDPAPWCIQYRGNGHYFKTVQEAFAYCESRDFKMEMPV